MSKSNAVGTRLNVDGVKVGGLNNLDGIDISAETLDVTDFDNSTGYRDFIAGFKEVGELTGSGFLDGDDAGQEKCYQLLNSGNTAVLETDNATITDTFDPLLSDISVALNGTALTAGTDYTYDEATGVFTTGNGVISIPAATYTQNPTTGEWTMTPGSSTMTVTGTVGAVSAD